MRDEGSFTAETPRRRGKQTLRFMARGRRWLAVKRGADTPRKTVSVPQRLGGESAFIYGVAGWLNRRDMAMNASVTGTMATANQRKYQSGVRLMPAKVVL